MEDLKEDIKDIKENHLPHIYTELTKNSTNIRWLMDAFKSGKNILWGILGSVITAVVLAVINLL